MRLCGAPTESSSSSELSSSCLSYSSEQFILVASRSSDQESYPYRIGTVHMCRDAAYADAGVLSGAFSSVPTLVNFTGVALDV